VIREERDFREQFLDQDPPLRVRCRLPDCLGVELREDGSNVLEPASHIVEFAFLSLKELHLHRCALQLIGQPTILKSEEVRADLVRVLEI